MFFVKCALRGDIKLQMLQILVVVANIQIRHLNTEQGGAPCEQ